jgi:hypothetical protein
LIFDADLLLTESPVCSRRRLAWLLQEAAVAAQIVLVSALEGEDASAFAPFVCSLVLLRTPSSFPCYASLATAQVQDETQVFKVKLQRLRYSTIGSVRVILEMLADPRNLALSKLSMFAERPELYDSSLSEDFLLQVRQTRKAAGYCRAIEMLMMMMMRRRRRIYMSRKMLKTLRY